MDSPEILVIGAGFAGAATGSALGGRGVLIVEKEAGPGFHASGKNAGIIRSLEANPEVAAFTREGAGALRNQGFVRQTGSVFLDPDFEGPCTSRGELSRFQMLRGARFNRATLATEDGVVDPSAVLQHYLDRFREKGGQALYECAVLGFRRDGSRIVAVETSRGIYRPRIVVNAAGAWVGRLGEQAGSRLGGFMALRRHLFLLSTDLKLSRDDPFVWNIAAGIYARPESGGVLASACDETPVEPGAYAMDPAMQDVLAGKIERCLPALGHTSVARSWACIRTFSPDRRLIIEWDRNVQNLFWVAGLGGWGVTAGAAIGRVAAERIRRGPPSPDSHAPKDRLGRPA